MTLAAPLVIGGMPGSGTRVVAAILRLSRSFIGTALSPALDAQEFLPFADRWVDAYVDAWANTGLLRDRPQMIEDFEDFVERHRATAEAPQAPWGWKAPRSICFLPFLDEQFPDQRYVHVIRDGRDIAFKGLGSDAQVPRSTAGRFSMGQSALLDEPTRAAPFPHRMLALWARINNLAADHGEAEMGERYLRLRLEDLCENPDETRRVLRFMVGREPSDDLVAAASGLVERPSTLGRWRDVDPDAVEAAIPAGAGALMRFEYTTRVESARGSAG